MADKSNVDRLSSLPNDILIDILSRLPIRLAIVTECLSSRWHDLWTNVTSVDITKRYCKTYSEFSAAFSDIVSQIKSPNIHNLTLQFTGLELSRPYDYSWLREICDRNLCRLKLTWPVSNRLKTKLPNFIFQTSSLVSIELHTEHALQLPDDGDSNPINLPNLRYLRLTFSKCELLHKLINACPSLEELSIKCKYHNPLITSFNCSNSNLRRLFLDLDYKLKVDVVINAPTLHYLAIYCPIMFLTLKFEEKSIGLRELKIVGDRFLAEEISVSKINGNWPFYNVRFLTLDVYTVNKISTRFCYVTRATLLMHSSHDIKSVLRLMELCPVLEILCLKCGLYGRTKQNTVQTSNDLSTFFRGPSTIIVETSMLVPCRNTRKPQKSFLEMIEYLLINGQNLKHFQFKLDDDDERYGCYRSHMSKEKRKEIRRRELNFCKLLYYSSTVLVECEVEFKGMFFNMSRKVGPKAWRTDSEEVIPLSDKSWNGFVLDEE